MKEPDELFKALVSEVGGCRACKRMDESERIFGAGSGRVDAPIMFVGEAPGRLGADASAIPFHGDKAGDNFERLISHVGLTRYDIFVTNAVLCNPKDQHGNNATPAATELRNCSVFLKAQITLVNPRLIVTLGGKALSALSLIEPHSIELASGLRKAWSWNGRTLIALYHPGQRAMIHRSFFNQMGDYQFVAETWKRIRGSSAYGSRKLRATKEPISEIARYILQAAGRTTYFALHKLFYMIEYEYVCQTGERISNAYVVRHKDGPYVTDLHFRRLKLALPELRFSQLRGELILEMAPCEKDFFVERIDNNSDVVREFVFDVTKRLAKLPASELKRRAYLTAPMREILRREKYGGELMYNSPLDFSLAYLRGYSKRG
jgi:uracil-DNA glycosylase family 4